MERTDDYRSDPDGGELMSILHAFIATLGAAPAPITVTTTWGGTSGSRLGTVTAVAQTINVPVGHPGNLNLSFSISAGTPGTVQYQKNAGTWTAVALSPSVTAVNFANTDTLNFRVLAASGTYTVAFTITDPLFGTTPRRTDSPLNPATCTISGT